MWRKLNKKSTNASRAGGRLRLTPLEDRLTPAAILTYTDIDGDQVTITSSRGDAAQLAATADFGLVGEFGKQLYRLNLDSNPVFEDAALTITARRADVDGDGVKEGDGWVNVGRISAAGLDLKTVVIDGDLGGINCGDGKAATGPGLGLLQVHSLGVYGEATQGGSGSVSSVVEGAFGALLVSRDIYGTIGARSFSDLADGKIGTIRIGGSLIGTGMFGGSLFATGDINSVRIGGDVVGGYDSTGHISCGGTLVSLKIGGSLIGGDGFLSGWIDAQSIESAAIGRDIRGGTNAGTGVVSSQGRIGRLTVGGSLVGGSGDQPFGYGSTDVRGQIIALGDIGSLRIAGDVVGGGGIASGSIQCHGNISELAIGGSLVGGRGDDSGKIDCFHTISRLAVGGSIVGGSGNHNVSVDPTGLTHYGQVFAVAIEAVRVRVRGDVIGGTGMGTGAIFLGGLGQSEMSSIHIGGDVIGGQNVVTGSIYANGGLANLRIGGSLIGGSAHNSGHVLVSGSLGAVSIGGDVQGGSIVDLQPSVENSGYIFGGGRIGRLFVGGSIIAGIDNSTGGDLIRNASVYASNIGSIIVRGSLVGTEGEHGVTRVVISALGQWPPGATTDLAIGSLSVGGRVRFADVLAGYFVHAMPGNGNASVGAVRVGGDWIASSLVAGIQDTDFNGFGTAGDSVINNADDPIVARIASVSIGGVIVGTTAKTDNFGFVAEQIGSFRAGTNVAALSGGQDVIELALLTGDVTIREV